MKKFLVIASLLYSGPAYGKQIHLTNSESAQLCKTMYMEDRQHGSQGMIAIGHLIFNRYNSKLFPKSISKIIHQKFQFTSWNTYKKINTHSKEYKIAKKAVVKSVSLYNHGIDLTNHALYYSRYDCHPKWRKHMKVTRVFGAHVFMKPRKK